MSAKVAAKSFEDLWIWQQARVLVKHVYEDFGRNTPAAQDFAYRSQIQRAATSIMNNIAEGFERSSDPEQARFLDVAKGSSGEVRSMYYIAEDLSYVPPKIADERRQYVRRLAAGIASMQTYLRKQGNNVKKSKGQRITNLSKPQ